MTVINMLSVREGGVAVADAQSSNSIRKMNTSEKLHEVGKGIIYGGTGPAFDLDMLADRSKAAINGDDNLERAARTVHAQVMDHLDDEKNRALYAELGLRLDSIQTGMHPSGSPLSHDTLNLGKQVLQRVTGENSLGVLVGGMEGEQFRAYLVASDGNVKRFSTPDSSIGSGRDESDKVFTQYISKIPREKRWDIDPKEGLVKAIEATNAASDINVGVGGTPSIMYVSNGQVYAPSENNATMATELVRGHGMGQLDRDFVQDTVYRLVTDEKVDFRSVSEDMLEQAKDKDRLLLGLRGFKVE